MMKYVSTNTPQFFRVPPRTPDKRPGQLEKGAHTGCSGSVVDAYRVAPILREACIPASVLSRMQVAWFTAGLMDYYASFLSRLCTF